MHWGVWCGMLNILGYIVKHAQYMELHGNALWAVLIVLRGMVLYAVNWGVWWCMMSVWGCTVEYAECKGVDDRA